MLCHEPQAELFDHMRGDDLQQRRSAFGIDVPSDSGQRVSWRPPTEERL
jgi:hypothetical protein